MARRQAEYASYTTTRLANRWVRIRRGQRVRRAWFRRRRLHNLRMWKRSYVIQALHTLAPRDECSPGAPNPPKTCHLARANKCVCSPA